MNSAGLTLCPQSEGWRAADAGDRRVALRVVRSAVSCSRLSRGKAPNPVRVEVHQLVYGRGDRRDPHLQTYYGSGLKTRCTSRGSEHPFLLLILLGK